MLILLALEIANIRDGNAFTLSKKREKRYSLQGTEPSRTSNTYGNRSLGEIARRKNAMLSPLHITETKKLDGTYFIYLSQRSKQALSFLIVTTVNGVYQNLTLLHITFTFNIADKFEMTTVDETRNSF